MLTPEEIKELKPKFEEINNLLNLATSKSEEDFSEEACGLYIKALLLMEELVDEIGQKEGHSVKEAFKRVMDTANSAEGAGVVGGLGAAAASLSFTGLGGFGLAAGGTAVGLSGLAGATVATGGAGLAGAAALYLAYKAGSAALESEPGQKVVDQATSASKRTAQRARSVGKKAAERLSKMRDARRSKDDGSSEA